MKRIRPALWALCASLVLLPARSAAQTPADSVGIARAVARLVGEQYAPSAGQGAFVLLLDSASRMASMTRFDSLMARELAALPAFRGPIGDVARVTELRTRGMQTWTHPPAEGAGLRGVVVNTFACSPTSRPDLARRGLWLWDMSHSLYLVRPGGGGWEVAGIIPLTSAHGSCPARTPRRRGGAR